MGQTLWGEVEMSNRSCELLCDIKDKTAALAATLGLDARQSARLADGIVDMLRKDWGGQQIYIPKALSERDMELYDKWNGKPEHLATLATEYHITIQRAYQIVKAVRAADMTRRQPDLFPSTES